MPLCGNRLTTNMTTDFVGIKNLLFYVIPAEAGIQSFPLVLDSRFHGSDYFEAFYEIIIVALGNI